MGFFNRLFSGKIQATQTEGGRDALTPSATQTQSTTSIVDKNNYATYSAQVEGVYDMYNGEAEYGSEIIRGIIDTRVSFVAGEGLTVYSEKKATQDFLNRFIKSNRLDGSRWIEIVQVAEMEGKCLLVLRQDPRDQRISFYPVMWHNAPYDIKTDNVDKTLVKSADFNVNGKAKSLREDRVVYVKTGGSPDKVNNTYTRVGTILTDAENYSRAKYDLRKNQHLFGRTTPYFETQTDTHAKSINNSIAKSAWKVGTSFAGTAKFSLVSQGTGAIESIRGEMLLLLKNITSTMGIPIHWLSWPELMSNRATAENLLEVINSATKRERLVWQESLHLLFEKAMTWAVDSGYEGNDIIGDFQVSIPNTSLAQIKQLIETWLPLMQEEVISMATLRGMVPGLDDSKEVEQIAREKEERMGRMPTFDNMRIGGNGEQNTGEDSGEQERTADDD